MNNDIPQQVAQVAQSVFESENQTPLRVWFLWYSNYPQTSNVHQLVDFALDLINQNIPQNILETSVIHTETIRPTLLHGFINSREMRRDMEMLSHKDFVDKWQL